MASEARGIQSIDVGGRVLAVLAKWAGPVMLRDLALATELPPAQVHAYLTSFRRIGLVEQDQQSGQYSMGSFALRLGLSRIRSVPGLAAASRALAPLSEETGLMTVIVVWGPRGPTVIQVQDGTEPLNLNIRIGTLFSVVGSASGWLFACFGKQEAINETARAELDGGKIIVNSTIKDLKANFEVEVAATRKRGYSVSSGVSVPGINAASAPVFDENGELLLGVTMVGKEADLPIDGDGDAIPRLLKIAENLSRLS